MNQRLSCLHPNPGWSGAAAQQPSSTPAISDAVGKHCILELYECHSSRLDDEAFLRDTITTAAKRAGATLLNLITHRFEPQGVTGLALLAESHISIHTWPERNFAALDIFVCGDCDPHRAVPVIQDAFSPSRIDLDEQRRGRVR
jgi:S-adenosylmethionine decarboxylase